MLDRNMKIAAAAFWYLLSVTSIKVGGGHSPPMSCPSPCKMAAELERNEALFKRDKLAIYTSTKALCERVNAVRGFLVEHRAHQNGRRTQINNKISRQQDLLTELQQRREQLVRIKNENADSVEELQQSVIRVEEMQEQVAARSEQLRNKCSVGSKAPEPCPHVITGTDCAEIYAAGGRTSGVYHVTIPRSTKLMLLFCDQETDGGGWTYVHTHVSNDIDFNRDWQSYKFGFGEVDCARRGENNYWVGNENLHLMTTHKHQHLRVDLEDWKGVERYALYTHFGVGSESTDYTLTISGYQADPKGSIGDGFAGHNFGKEDDVLITKHNGMPFSTADHDNDMYIEGNCALQGSGGWWYNSCSAVNLNGKIYQDGYYRSEDTEYGFDNGMIWGPWKGVWYSLRKSSMKIRPASFSST